MGASATVVETSRSEGCFSIYSPPMETRCYCAGPELPSLPEGRPQVVPLKSAVVLLLWIPKLVRPTLHTACPKGGQRKPQISPQQTWWDLKKVGSGVRQTWVPHLTSDSRSRASFLISVSLRFLGVKRESWEPSYRLVLRIKCHNACRQPLVPCLAHSGYSVVIGD